MRIILAPAVVTLAFYGVRFLPVSPVWSLAALLVLTLCLFIEHPLPFARHGLRPPPRIRDAQVLTLAAFFAGAVLAYGSAQVTSALAKGAWLHPLPRLHLGLLPFFLGRFALFAALPEELLLRGYVQTSVRAGLGGALRDIPRRSLAIVLVAAFSLVLHFPFVQIHSLLGVGLLGLLLGWLRERTGSLAAPFLCHAAFNATLAWIEVSHG